MLVSALGENGIELTRTIDSEEDEALLGMFYGVIEEVTYDAFFDVYKNREFNMALERMLCYLEPGGIKVKRIYYRTRYMEKCLKRIFSPFRSNAWDTTKYGCISSAFNK